MAITSKEINLNQLTNELGGKGLVADFNDPEKKIILAADGVELSDAELNTAIEAHVAINEAEAKATQRQVILSRLGITEEEARILLGGN
jgi:hypothetical protein